MHGRIRLDDHGGGENAYETRADQLLNLAKQGSSSGVTYGQVQLNTA